MKKLFLKFCIIQGFRLATLSKRDSDTDVPKKYCEIFKETSLEKHLRKAASRDSSCLLFGPLYCHENNILR